MERSFQPVAKATPCTAELLKLSLLAICQRLSNEDILDLADQLHELIRDRRHRVAGDSPFESDRGRA